MPHVITQSCCSDASCVFACPVNAIHPNPHDPAFATAEMLYIDPVACVDCGACVDACPVGAIVPAGKLRPEQLPFVDVNARYSGYPERRPAQAPVPRLVRLDPERLPLRVAVVGSGPAALYAADELLKQRGVEVTVVERLPTPYGLVRSGVAPDHPDTKKITSLFWQIENRPGFRYLLGVDVGRDVTHDELLSCHSAVVYATGAAHDRRLGIAGEDLTGSDTATRFVAWYNGHPDHADHSYDLTSERAVVVGNGNVALDVARILATDPDRLAATDISDVALQALRASQVREVVVLARRSPAEAAFTLPELLGLLSRPDLEVVRHGPPPAPYTGPDDAVAQKVEAVRALPPAEQPRGARRRIVLRFLTSPVALLGADRVTAAVLAQNELTAGADGRPVAVPTGATEELPTGLVLRSIGYRGVPVPDLPFDDVRGVVPNDDGRVLGRDRTYVVGWIKRGPTGFIGTNKSCARDTVNRLLDDVNAGRVGHPARTATEFDRLVRERCPHATDVDGWRRIDAVERSRGQASGRPRVKVTEATELAALGGQRSARARVPG